MGVIWVVHEASRRGFVGGHPDWCNLGQGQPEVGSMEGPSPRRTSVEIRPEDHAYGPPAARASCARASPSTTTASTGRARSPSTPPTTSASAGRATDAHARLHPVPIRARAEDGFEVAPERLASEFAEKGLSALVLGNPCNPTDNVIQGAVLRDLVASGRERDVAARRVLQPLHLHTRGQAGRRAGQRGGVRRARSGARLRRPDHELPLPRLARGLDLGSQRHDREAGARGELDRRRPLAHRAALAVLEPARADPKKHALLQAFARERSLLVERLESLGIRSARRPESTFYGWATLEDLSAPLGELPRVLLGRAGTQGHDRARRFLRRGPRQAPPRRESLQDLGALLLRPADRQPDARIGSPGRPREGSLAGTVPDEDASFPHLAPYAGRVRRIGLRTDRRSPSTLRRRARSGRRPSSTRTYTISRPMRTTSSGVSAAPWVRSTRPLRAWPPSTPGLRLSGCVAHRSVVERSRDGDRCGQVRLTRGGRDPRQQHLQHRLFGEPSRVRCEREAATEEEGGPRARNRRAVPLDRWVRSGAVLGVRARLCLGPGEPRRGISRFSAARSCWPRSR